MTARSTRFHGKTCRQIPPVEAPGIAVWRGWRRTALGSGVGGDDAGERRKRWQRGELRKVVAEMGERRSTGDRARRFDAELVGTGGGRSLTVDLLRWSGSLVAAAPSEDRGTVLEVPGRGAFLGSGTTTAA